MSNKRRVRFVVAPFYPVHVPALGVSSLKAVLLEASIPADIFYFNVDFLDCLSGRTGLYGFLQRVPYYLLMSEMIFTKALWGDSAPGLDAYCSRFRSEQDQYARSFMGMQRKRDNALFRVPSSPHPDERDLFSCLKSLYEEAPAIVRGWAVKILEGSPRVVCFTVTAQQNIASLALAREISLAAGNQKPLILFGGANCFEENGKALLENFPFIDGVVAGEGEDVITDLVTNAGEGRGVQRNPGFVIAPPVQDLDRLPVPDFHDYFRAIEPYPWLRKAARLVAESSRGCWWGAKSHCRFCARNSSTIAFRRKAPERVAKELTLLTEAYGKRSFLMADNILDTRLITPLSRLLKNHHLDIYYEVSATLNRTQLKEMVQAGIRKIQPGIESLDTGILRSMGKGTTRLKNIRLLKQARELEMRVLWNFLYGFPEEMPDDYHEMARLIPLIFHLPPPKSAVPIVLMRFSPYWQDPKGYGMTEVHPYWAYDYIYPELSATEKKKLAFYFTFQYNRNNYPAKYITQTLRMIVLWRKRFRRGAMLKLVESQGDLYVYDTRFFGPLRADPLSPLEHSLVKIISEIRPLRTVRKELLQIVAPESKTRYESMDIDRALNRFRSKNWVVEEDGQILGLVMDPSTEVKGYFESIIDQGDPFGLRDLLEST